MTLEEQLHAEKERNYEIYHENSILRSELAELYDLLNKHHEWIDTIGDLMVLYMNHPDSKECRVWRRGIIGMLEVMREDVAEVMAERNEDE